jgi:hypothetical protein
MITWTSRVRTANGASVQVTVQAESMGLAKMLLESQYGAENLLHLPTPL